MNPYFTFDDTILRMLEFIKEIQTSMQRKKINN